jgi:acetyl-CoA carboxylase biotin carboxyl carrier protein
MDLKEIQNLIKFVANSGVAEVKLEMDDIKITIRTTIEGTATETTYVQQMPAHNQQAIVQNAAPVARRHPVVEENKYITISLQSLELL